MLDKIKQFVDKSFRQINRSRSLKHFDRTVYWTKKIKPDADEPILIAAYAHDISRAFNEELTIEKSKNRDLTDSRILRKHQDESARIVVDFLRKENYDENLIKRIDNMVRHHEEGGDEESDLIKDVDTLSFLEVNAPRLIKTLVKVLGKEKIRRKIDYMYNRISSAKAKSFAEPYHEKAIKLLDAV